ncbi:MAG TPA: protein kinase [Planctomycetota bacterium]|nr:protein kinase [Planctomycetota bacterium]
MSENATREAPKVDRQPMDKCPNCNLLLLEPVTACPGCGADFKIKPSVPGYRIEAEIGQDRWGGVYQAFRKSDGFEFELHMIDAARIGGEGALDPLIDKIRELTSLTDMHLVLLKGAGRTDTAAYFLTEKPRGEALSRLLEKTPVLSEIMCVKIVLDLARAFDELERQGVRHGRITARDIVLGVDGSAQLKHAAVTDLFAKTAPHLFENVEDIAHAAPEEFTFGARGFLSDQYSLGAVIYRAVSGATPFQGKEPEEVKTKVLMTRPAAPKLASPGMRTLLAQMLAKDPASRFESPTTLYKAAGKLGAAILAKRMTGTQIPIPPPDEAPPDAQRAGPGGLPSDE